MKTLINLSLVLGVTLISCKAIGGKQETAAIHGRIIDLWGNSLSGAELKVYLLIFQNGSLISADGKLEKTTTTDEQGNYAMSGLPPGEYRISVDSPGFRHREAFRVSLWAGSNAVLDLGLEVGDLMNMPLTEIKGTVRRQDKSNLQDASVVAISAFNSQIMEQVRTDEAGRYNIRLRTPGQYLVYAGKPGFAVSAGVIFSEGQTSIDFLLKPIPLRQR